MRRRTVGIGCAATCIAALGALGVAIWSLPPQFLPEAVYRLKFGGLYPASRPAGDGTFIDFGPRASIDRYVVDLGPVADDRHLDRAFEIGTLPAEQFVVGFSVTGPPDQESMKFEKPDIGEVRLEVTTDAGELVIVEGGPLSDWTWSGPLSVGNYAFVFRVRHQRSDAAADQAMEGTGTIFTPSPGRHYRVHVRADWKPDTPGNYKIRLLLTGGGWKMP